MTIRPSTFDDFTGQSKVVSNLRVVVKSAAVRKVPLGHMLLVGPAGLGKTTLATCVIPTELGVKAKSINCSAIDRAQTFTSVVSTMRRGEILFLDELHMLPPFAREHLLTIMEDNKLHITVETGSSGIMEVELDPFTVIGATTRQGVLDDPMRSRFKHIVRLEPYDRIELSNVCGWIAAQKRITIDSHATNKIVDVARGTPRHAVNIIDACVDTHIYNGGSPDDVIIEGSTALATLKRLGFVGEFSPDEWRYLCYLSRNSPCSLSTIAAALDEQPRTVEDVIEPSLIRAELIKITSRGRVITDFDPIEYGEAQARLEGTR